MSTHLTQAKEKFQYLKCIYQEFASPAHHEAGSSERPSSILCSDYGSLESFYEMIHPMLQIDVIKTLLEMLHDRMLQDINKIGHSINKWENGVSPEISYIKEDVKLRLSILHVCLYHFVMLAIHKSWLVQPRNERYVVR